MAFRQYMLICKLVWLLNGDALMRLITKQVKKDAKMQFGVLLLLSAAKQSCEPNDWAINYDIKFLPNCLVHKSAAE